MTREQRSMALGGLSVVILAVAAYLFFTRGGGRAELPSVYTIDGVCLACKQECKASFNEGESPPLVCPNCQAGAVFQWNYCYECNMRFVARPGANGKPPMVPVCVNCGSSRTGAVDLADPRQQPIGDAKLPAAP